jgi:hypothetical protein
VHLVFGRDPVELNEKEADIELTGHEPDYTQVHP